jgi:hypothetical protein
VRSGQGFPPPQQPTWLLSYPHPPPSPCAAPDLAPIHPHPPPRPPSAHPHSHQPSHLTLRVLSFASHSTAVTFTTGCRRASRGNNSSRSRSGKQKQQQQQQWQQWQAAATQQHRSALVAGSMYTPPSPGRLLLAVCATTHGTSTAAHAVLLPHPTCSMQGDVCSSSRDAGMQVGALLVLSSTKRCCWVYSCCWCWLCSCSCC